MFKVKQLFTKNDLFLLLITLFLVHFNSYEVIRNRSLEVSKSYQNNQVQSNLGLTDKCGPTTVRCWKKSVKRKRSVPHSVTIVCTSTANIAYLVMSQCK